MSVDREEFEEAFRVAAARQPAPVDPEAEQAMDDAIRAARPRTLAHMQSLLEPDEVRWAALLKEEIAPGLPVFGDVVEILVRKRAEYEALGQLGDAIEESVAADFSEAVALELGDVEVSEVADAMLRDGSFTSADLERVAEKVEGDTAIAIAAIREQDLGTSRRQELGQQLQLASLKLILS